MTIATPIRVATVAEIAASWDSDAGHSASGIFEVFEGATPESLVWLREKLHAQEVARHPVCASVFSVGTTTEGYVQVTAHNQDGC